MATTPRASPGPGERDGSAAALLARATDQMLAAAEVAAEGTSLAEPLVLMLQVRLPEGLAEQVAQAAEVAEAEGEDLRHLPLVALAAAAQSLSTTRRNDA